MPSAHGTVAGAPADPDGIAALLRLATVPLSALVE
jgi:hypothetical protein